jgi:hypothetical protein
VTTGLRIGDRVQERDRLRTGPGDRGKIVLIDDAVIDIGPSTEIVIESIPLRAEEEMGGLVVTLVQGRLRAALAPEHEPGARLEIETRAAVAFRGRTFLVSHEPTADVTRVVAVEGPVSVAGKLGVVGGVLEVEPGSGTDVRRGRRPGPLQEIDPLDLDLQEQSIAVSGTGRRDGLDVLHPALMGMLLQPGDVLSGTGGGPLPDSMASPATETLAEQMSADVRTNTQPLLEYKRRDPGVPSRTGVGVEF